jgi:hypothetical protein
MRLSGRLQTTSRVELELMAIGWTGAVSQLKKFVVVIWDGAAGANRLATSAIPHDFWAGFTSVG